MIAVLALSRAVRLEEMAGASGMPDVEADLRYAARLLREQVGQCEKVIDGTQPWNVERGRTYGARAASGAVTHRVGWAVAS